MKTLLCSCLFLLLAVVARAEEKPKWDIGLIVGNPSAYASIGTSIESYCYPSSDGPNLPAVDSPLLISEIKQCSKSYGSPESFYGVVLRGKKYYAKTSDLRVKETDLAKLTGLSETDRAQYEAMLMVSTRRWWAERASKSFDFLKKTAKDGVAVLKASIYDMSEYTEGTGFRITFYNPTKKTIKYVTVTYVGYNAVNDPIQDYRLKKKTLTLKGIGPIEPDASASYSQDYAWMTDAVDSFKLTGITLQYMDGSKKIVKLRIPMIATG